MTNKYHDDPMDILFRNFFNMNQFETAVNNKIDYPVDIYVNKDGLHMNIATVGIDKKDITVQIEEGDCLRISYDKPETENDETIQWIHRRIVSKSFNFGWRINNKFDLEKLVLKSVNGLLSITIPLAERAKPKQIEIQ